MKDAGNSQNPKNFSFTIREWLRPFASWRHAALLLAVILVFAWLGPFGTSETLAAAQRLLYWTLAIGLNWALGLLVVPISMLLMREMARREWIGLALGALVAALPGTGVIYLLQRWFSEPPTLAGELAYLYMTVAILHLVLGYLARELIGRSERQSAPFADMHASQFLKRLSPSLGENLLHLHMRDHYVEAHTDKGSELVLMRFGDALREVEGLDGARVHRSHWVASCSVQCVRRHQGRVMLQLSNGEEVPVSRSYRGALRHFEGRAHQ